MSVVTVYDVIAVDEGDTSGNVPQGAQDEVQVRLLGLWIMPQADCQRIRDRGITELLGQQRKIGCKFGLPAVLPLAFALCGTLNPKPWPRGLGARTVLFLGVPSPIGQRH